MPAAVASKPKKVRGINPETGKWNGKWVTVDEAAPVTEVIVAPAPAPRQSVQKQAMVELTGTILGFDEDGEEIRAEGGVYDDYLNSMPSREERSRFRTPVYYWEVRYPGCTLQPYPQLGSFRSRDSGVWELEYPYQERAVREHILSSVHVDPDTLRITDHELAVMDGRSTDGRIMYCQDGGCAFVSCNLGAIALHEDLTGHSFKNKPRED